VNVQDESWWAHTEARKVMTATGVCDDVGGRSWEGVIDVDVR
jgi:hypothetical protein